MYKRDNPKKVQRVLQADLPGPRPTIKVCLLDVVHYNYYLDMMAIL